MGFFWLGLVVYRWLYCEKLYKRIGKHISMSSPNFRYLNSGDIALKQPTCASTPETCCCQITATNPQNALQDHWLRPYFDLSLTLDVDRVWCERSLRVENLWSGEQNITKCHTGILSAFIAHSKHAGCPSEWVAFELNTQEGPPPPKPGDCSVCYFNENITLQRVWPQNKVWSS